MADVLIRSLEGERVAIHFGGAPGGINSYTFGQSLLGLTATALAVNRIINPGEEIEIVIEANARGSFRAVLRRIRKGKTVGIFSEGARAILWGVIAAIIYDQVFKSEPKQNIIINTDEVIIEQGHDRIIVPRHVYEAAQNACKSNDVQRGISRTFTPLEANPDVSEFGITRNITDDVPIVRIPRERFMPLASRSLIVEPQPEKVRQQTQTARVLILKAWVNHKRRKWTFEWNGAPVSAPIVDDEFLNKIDRRDYRIGAGDALDVEITVIQHYDAGLGVYVNDPRSYLITRVIDVIEQH